MRKSSLLNKGTALWVAFVLSVSSPTLPELHAAPVNAAMPALPGNIFQDLTAIQIPQNIGEVQEIYRGGEGRLVILIQDAHSVPDAQNSIRSLLGFFQERYGIDLALLEGTSSPLDPQIFRSFPDQELLKTTFKKYMAGGELTGGTAAAVFNRTEARYLGLEDWDLYEKEIGFYLSAAAKEKEISSAVDLAAEHLESLKKETYSPELLKIDEAVSSFHRNKLELLKLLMALNAVQPPEPGTHLEALLKGAADSEPAVSVEIEVKTLGEKVRKSLMALPPSPEVEGDRSVFNLESQKFQTSQISAQEFGLTLRKMISKYRMPHEVSSALKERIGRQKRMQDIKGTQVFRELEAYIHSVKKSLFRNEAEARLDREIGRLDLVERLMRLELTQEDWEQLSGMAEESTQWPILQDDVREAPKIAELLTMLEPHQEFYRTAHKRDLVFVQNTLKEMARNQKQETVVVAGGFHTEGLTRQLKSQGVSYVLVMPKMESLPETPLYREHMQGNVSWKKYFKVEDGRVNLYGAFVRGTRDLLLKQSVEDRGVLLKKWRDQIIRDLADKGEIEKAKRYLDFIDEVLEQNPKRSELREKWLSAVDRFMDQLGVFQKEGRLTKENVLSVLKPSVAAESVLAGALAAPVDGRTTGLNPALLNVPLEGALSTVRSELRSDVMNRRNFLTAAAGLAGAVLISGHIAQEKLPEAQNQPGVIQKTESPEATPFEKLAPSDQALIERAVSKLSTLAREQGFGDLAILMNSKFFDWKKMFYVYAKQEAAFSASGKAAETNLGINPGILDWAKSGDPAGQFMLEATVLHEFIHFWHFQDRAVLKGRGKAGTQSEEAVTRKQTAFILGYKTVSYRTELGVDMPVSVYVPVADKRVQIEKDDKGQEFIRNFVNAYVDEKVPPGVIDLAEAAELQNLLNQNKIHSDQIERVKQEIQKLKDSAQRSMRSELRETVLPAAVGQEIESLPGKIQSVAARQEAEVKRVENLLGRQQVLEKRLDRLQQIQPGMFQRQKQRQQQALAGLVQKELDRISSELLQAQSIWQIEQASLDGIYGEFMRAWTKVQTLIDAGSKELSERLGENAADLVSALTAALKREALLRLHEAARELPRYADYAGAVPVPAEVPLPDFNNRSASAWPLFRKEPAVRSAWGAEAVARLQESWEAYLLEQAFFPASAREKNDQQAIELLLAEAERDEDFAVRNALPLMLAMWFFRDPYTGAESFIEVDLLKPGAENKAPIYQFALRLSQLPQTKQAELPAEIRGMMEVILDPGSLFSVEEYPEHLDHWRSDPEYRANASRGMRIPMVQNPAFIKISNLVLLASLSAAGTQGMLGRRLLSFSSSRIGTGSLASLDEAAQKKITQTFLQTTEKTARVEMIRYLTGIFTSNPEGRAQARRVLLEHWDLVRTALDPEQVESAAELIFSNFFRYVYADDFKQEDFLLSAAAAGVSSEQALRALKIRQYAFTLWLKGRDPAAALAEEARTRFENQTEYLFADYAGYLKLSAAGEGLQTLLAQLGAYGYVFRPAHADMLLELVQDPQRQSALLQSLELARKIFFDFTYVLDESVEHAPEPFELQRKRIGDYGFSEGLARGARLEELQPLLSSEIERLFPEASPADLKTVTDIFFKVDTGLQTAYFYLFLKFYARLPDHLHEFASLSVPQLDAWQINVREIEQFLNVFENMTGHPDKEKLVPYLLEVLRKRDVSAVIALNGFSGRQLQEPQWKFLTDFIGDSEVKYSDKSKTVVLLSDWNATRRSIGEKLTAESHGRIQGLFLAYQAGTLGSKKKGGINKLRVDLEKEVKEAKVNVFRNIVAARPAEVRALIQGEAALAEVLQREDPVLDEALQEFEAKGTSAAEFLQKLAEIDPALSPEALGRVRSAVEKMEHVSENLTEDNRILVLASVYYSVGRDTLDFADSAEFRERIKYALRKIFALESLQSEMLPENFITEADAARNKAEQERLIAKGYDPSLWKEGVAVEALAGSGMTEEEKGYQRKNYARQVREVLNGLGIANTEIPDDVLSHHDTAKVLFEKEVFGNEEQKDQAVQKVLLELKTSRGQKTDAQLLQQAEGIVDAYINNLHDVLRVIETMDRVPTLDETSRYEPVTLVLRKNILDESGIGLCSGSGCFNPVTGIHREMPFVGAVDGNYFTGIVKDKNGVPISTAVMAFTDAGVVVFGEYNGSPYGLDAVWAEGWKQLASKVPAIILNETSAGRMNAGKQGLGKVNVSKEQGPFVKKATLWTSPYFDFGSVVTAPHDGLEKGDTEFSLTNTLTITRDSVNQEEARRATEKMTRQLAGYKAAQEALKAPEGAAEEKAEEKKVQEPAAVFRAELDAKIRALQRQWSKNPLALIGRLNGLINKEGLETIAPGNESFHALVAGYFGAGAQEEIALFESIAFEAAAAARSELRSEAEGALTWNDFKQAIAAANQAYIEKVRKGDWVSCGACSGALAADLPSLIPGSAAAQVEVSKFRPESLKDEQDVQTLKKLLLFASAYAASNKRSRYELFNAVFGVNFSSGKMNFKAMAEGEVFEGFEDFSPALRTEFSSDLKALEKLSDNLRFYAGGYPTPPSPERLAVLKKMRTVTPAPFDSLKKFESLIPGFSLQMRSFGESYGASRHQVTLARIDGRFHLIDLTVSQYDFAAYPIDEVAILEDVNLEKLIRAGYIPAFGEVTGVSLNGSVQNREGEPDSYIPFIQAARSELRLSDLSSEDFQGIALAAAGAELARELQGLVRIEIPVSETAAGNAVRSVSTLGLDATRQRLKEAVLMAFLQSQTQGAAAVASTRGSLAVLRAEAQALIQSLGQLEDRKYTIGLALAGEAVPADNRLIPQLLSSMKDGHVSEVVLDGALPKAAQNRFKENGAALRPAQFSRSMILLNDQPAVPLLILKNSLARLDAMFIPIQADFESVEDPMVIDYVELLRSVAALHMADLLATHPELLGNGELLKAALLARLQRFGENFEQILAHDENGWVIKGTLARAYLEMRVAEAVSASA